MENPSTLDVVFCILVYKNYSDLLDCITSIKNNCNFSYKIVIINSFYDDSTMQKVQNIAEENDCCFLNIENKGYGYGNNAGITFAIKNFSFDYLIVCNPDIVIKNFDYQSISHFNNKDVIIAPEIKCVNGKRQNPAFVKKDNFVIKLEAQGYKKNSKFLLYFGTAINKLRRIVFNLFNLNNRKIFMAHGSFVIFSKGALKKLYPVYDENIFLFSEELDIAIKSRKNNINTYYVSKIKINHKEDGSMKLSNVNIYNENKKSFLYVVNKWQ